MNITELKNKIEEIVNENDLAYLRCPKCDKFQRNSFTTISQTIYLKENRKTTFINYLFECSDCGNSFRKQISLENTFFK